MNSVAIELPAGWVSTRLGDLYSFEYGKSLIKGSRASAGKYPVYGSSGIVGMHDQYLIEGPAIIVGRKGAAGSVSYSTDNLWPIDTTYYVRDDKNLSLKFSYYLFRSLNLAKLEASTAIPGLNRNHAYDETVFLPPLAEQHRIVAKIEGLFSELDKGVENLKTARAQLKVYRQALLKHAFEGKITAQWRAENQGKLETADALLKRIQQERAQRYQQQLADWEASSKQRSKPKAPKPLPPLTAEELAELPELPEGWGWVRPEEICAQEQYAIGIGPFGSNLKVSDYRESGVPLIFVKNITRSNFSSDLKHIDEAKYRELMPHSVKALDLLITKMGDPPGDCEIYPEGSPNAVLTADCLKFRLWDKYANRKLYKYCINSNFVKRQLGLITKGVAQKKISVERFKTICLPLFCVEEQKVLIREIESKLSECDQLDKTLTTALQQAEALRQSILKKAFSGLLVPQDPHDEPASALLARIKAARAEVGNNAASPHRTKLAHIEQRRCSHESDTPA